jgi:hypothetical protein
MKKLSILLLVFCIVLNVSADRHLTRGHQAGELYIASTWFEYIDTVTVAIFYTDDHGKSLIMRYYFAQNSGAMPVGDIVTDHRSGVIYNEPVTTLWISTDMAYSWEECQAPAPYGVFTAGNMPGQVYELFTNEPAWRVELHRSTDFGNSFTCVNDSISGRPEVCTTENGIYLYYHSHGYNELAIKYSDDYGASFPTVFVLDSMYAGNYHGPQFPVISRGTKAGEIFLVTLFHDNIFKIFYSTDFGQSFDLKYISTPCDFSTESYSFSAGLEEGSFYFSKTVPLYNWTANTLLCIYHSSDTAKTFTEYCHILDTGFPVSVHDDDIVEDKLNELVIYPNPVGSTASIKLDSFLSGHHTIEVFSISGVAVIREDKFFQRGDQEVKINAGHLNPGIYVCSIKANGKVVGVRKFVKGG